MAVRTIILLLFILAFNACRNQSDEAADDYGGRLAEWFAYYGITAAEMAPAGSFKNHVLPSAPFYLTGSQPFEDLLVFTDDSILALDLDSYHLVLETSADGTIYALGREADMEIGLVNLKKNTRQRILFCGTPCLFEEGDIMPDGRVVIAGFTEDEGMYAPTLWKISPDFSQIAIFMAEMHKTADQLSYVPEVRLSHIRFDFAPGPPQFFTPPLP